MKFMSEQMPAQDLEFLHDLCQREGVRTAANVGTYTGRSAIEIARTAKEVWCIDNFEGNPGAAGDMNATYKKPGAVYEQLLKNLSESPHPARFRIVIGDSAGAAHQVPDGLDLVFIDADHRYSGIRRDIEAWRGKVRPGGILCGHDFEMPLEKCNPALVAAHCEEDFFGGRHYGVIRAVGEAFPGARKGGAQCWWVRT